MPDEQDMDIGISKYARDKIIDHLKLSYTHDLLEEEDFEKRIQIAINTKDKNKLNVLVEDLPDEITVVKSNNQVNTNLSINKGEVQPTETIIGVLADKSRKGSWKPSRYIKTIVVMGDVKLDFTMADLAPGTTEINIFCVMGDVKITVAPGVIVDENCQSILAGVKNRTESIGHSQSAPTLKIRGFVLMGDLKINPPGKTLLTTILNKFGLQ